MTMLCELSSFKVVPPGTAQFPVYFLLRSVLCKTCADGLKDTYLTCERTYNGVQVYFWLGAVLFTGLVKYSSLETFDKFGVPMSSVWINSLIVATVRVYRTSQSVS